MNYTYKYALNVRKSLKTSVLKGEHQLRQVILETELVE